MNNKIVSCLDFHSLYPTVGVTHDLYYDPNTKQLISRSAENLRILKENEKKEEIFDPETGKKKIITTILGVDVQNKDLLLKKYHETEKDEYFSFYLINIALEIYHNFKWK